MNNEMVVYLSNYLTPPIGGQLAGMPKPGVKVEYDGITITVQKFTSKWI